MFFKMMLAAVVIATPAAAEWRAAPAPPPDGFAAETRRHVSTVTTDGLPDGLVAPSAADIAGAWYEQPTRRYAHAILGDDVEAGALVVEDASGARARLILPDHQVFEDRAPRVVDLDGDGRAEIVAIRASSRGGAGAAVYGLRAGGVEEIAATGEIGTPNRWLNIASLADLDGDGRREIAFVRTPHIGGTLRVFAFDGADLTLVDEVYGFSNHAIGAREMRLSAVIQTDGGPALAIPSADRRRIRVMALREGRLVELASVDLGGRAAGPIAPDGAGVLIGLEGGAVVRAAPR